MLLFPFKLNVAPATFASFTAEVEPNACVPPATNVPAFTIVAPVYVFVDDTVIVPLPDFVSDAVPETTSVEVPDTLPTPRFSGNPGPETRPSPE